MRMRVASGMLTVALLMPTIGRAQVYHFPRRRHR